MFKSPRSFIDQRFCLISLAGVATLSFFAFLTPATSAEPSRSFAASDLGRVGSLALSDLNETLLNQSPQLKQEIQQALKEVNKDDVGCFAPLFYRPFDPLNNSRIAPFTCLFAKNKSLTIQAKNVAKLPDGSSIPLEQLLRGKNIPEGASLEFELTSWKWTKASD